jgi:transposase-like protein
MISPTVSYLGGATAIPNEPIQIDLSESEETYIQELFEGLKGMFREILCQSIETILEMEVDRYLKRKRYRRRKKMREQPSERMVCNQCGSRDARNFRRNGHYRRGLSTNWGYIEFNMPQIECICGGGVRVKYRTIQHRQRIWNDLEAHFRSESGYGMSLREIKEKMDVELKGSLGLRTINDRIHRANDLMPIWERGLVESVPPVMRLDGIWVKLMIPTENVQHDAMGRKRVVKTRKTLPVLVAQGVWPAEGRQEILAWIIAEGEDKDSWGDLIFRLRDKGIRLEEMKLVIGDGSSGLASLLQQQYPFVPFQRCVFHKIKNLWRDLVEPEGMDRDQIRHFKRDLINEATEIWRADHARDAGRKMQDFSTKWETDQPKMVATLQRDFDLTLTFYEAIEDAAQNGQSWPPEQLRTISHLERDNRRVRKRLRNAVLYHSRHGLSAALCLNYARGFALPNDPLPGRWHDTFERQIAEATYFLI